MTELLSTTKADLKKACQFLRSGAIIAIPTDTIYGLACLASNELAVRKIASLKGRASTKPIALLIENTKMGANLIKKVPKLYYELAEKFWPGALTLIVPHNKHVSSAITGTSSGVGLRVPNHPVTLALLRLVGEPLAVTSANNAGDDPITCPSEIFSHFNKRIACVINAGKSTSTSGSTVCSLLSDPPTIFRQGKIHCKF